MMHGVIAMATIVVIDDEELVRDFVVKALETRSHTVIAFPDAAQALEEADFGNVDLVITDLRMPTPGRHVITTLRERNIPVPIIVMSGYIEEDDMEYLLSIGTQAILLKPFTIESLFKVVQAWI